MYNLWFDFTKENSGRNFTFNARLQAAVKTHARHTVFLALCTSAVLVSRGNAQCTVLPTLPCNICS